MNRGGYLEWISANVLQTARVCFVTVAVVVVVVVIPLTIPSANWRFHGNSTANWKFNHPNHRDIVAALPCSKCYRTVPFTEWLHLSWIWLMLNQTQTRNTSSACWESVDWSFARVEHGDQVSRTRNSDHAARKCDMFVYSIVHNKIAWLSNMADTHLF